MSLVVQKFGGSSLSTAERIKKVAGIIAGTKKQKHQVVVVVSAMAGETDRLLGLSRELSPAPPGREQDALIATGEQASSALTAIALDSLNCPARSFMGLQLPLLTDDSYTRARILELGKGRVLN